MKVTAAFSYELSRYIINGLVATAVHYGILVLLLEWVRLESAGIAGLIASVFGISASFFGSRYFVFPGQQAALHTQAFQFAALYALLALVHGATLYIWSDRLQLSYHIGFLLATGIQLVLSYTGNKFIVFNNQ